MNIVYHDASKEAYALNSKLQKENIINNKIEYEKFIYNLNKLYKNFSDYPEKYRKKSERVKVKVEELNEDRIYQYIYKCMLLNEQCGL